MESEEQILPIDHPPLTERRKHYPYWSNPGIHAHNEIGDSYGALATDVSLTIEQPYPGDELFESNELCPEEQFKISKQTYRDYIVDGSPQARGLTCAHGPLAARKSQV